MIKIRDHRVSQIVTFFLSVICFSFVISCDEPPKTNDANKVKVKQLKEGLYTTKHSNGKVHTQVNYKSGKKDGVSTSYFSNGNKQLEMTYVNGERSGNSYKYYESGKLYAETPYVNNEINGIRKTFYSNGQVKAETPYQNSLMGVGSNLYSNAGKLLDPYKLKIKKLGAKTYEVSTDKKCRRVVFFEGDLIKGKYLDESQVVALPMSNENGVFNNKFNKSKLNFICKCTTAGSTTFIINKSL